MNITLTVATWPPASLADCFENKVGTTFFRDLSDSDLPRRQHSSDIRGWPEIHRQDLDLTVDLADLEDWHFVRSASPMIAAILRREE